MKTNTSTACNRLTLYIHAIKVFGPESQALRLMADAAELAAAAARNLNGLGNEADLASELANIEIMIEQFRLSEMGLAIDAQKQKKLERLAEQLGVTYAAE